MKCALCNDVFYVKRGLLNLFKTEKEYICNKCYRKYPIHLSYEAIQLDQYSCIILSMFDEKYRIDYNAFYKEYSKIFNANFERVGYHLFFFNHLDLTDDTLEVLDAISKLVEENIIILCLSVVK